MLKSRVVDEVQVDALTYCTSDGSSSGASWGRMQRKGASDADEVEWSHYAIGMFACRTQDEWLCRARTGRNDCASMDLRTQLDGGVAGSTRMGVDLRKLIRNETQSEMVTQSDRICDRYLASIVGEQAGNALMLDTTMSLLNGAASIATGNTARNLSASSAFLGATKSHIDADVYQSQVSTAINLMIRKNRATARETIRNNQACAPDANSAAEPYRTRCPTTTPVRSSMASASSCMRRPTVPPSGHRLPPWHCNVCRTRLPPKKPSSWTVWVLRKGSNESTTAPICVHVSRHSKGLESSCLPSRSRPLGTPTKARR